MTRPDKTILIANAIFPCSEDKNFHRCYLCDSSQSYDDSLRHITSQSHVERLKNFDTTFVNLGENFNCKICARIIDWKDLKCHATEHEMVPWYKPPELYKIFFDNQTLEFLDKFYCYPCDEICGDRTAALIHKNNKSHKKKLKAQKNDTSLDISKCCPNYEQLVNNGMFKCEGTNVRCKICDCSNKIDIKNFDQHVTGFHHRNEKLKLIQNLNNRISRKMADERTIDFSNDSFVEFENDYEQVPCCSNGHESSRLNLAANGDESKNENQPITLDIPKKLLDGAITKKNPLSRDYIVEKSETDFSCMICNSKTTSKCNVQGHVSRKRHTKRRNKFHDNGIILMENNNFYCDYCKLEFEDSPRIWNHIDSKEHKSSRLEKTANVAETKNENQPITLDIPKKPLDGAITKKNPLSRDYIVEQSETDFSCMICNLKTISKCDVQGHVSRKRHTKRRNKLHRNGIILMENNNFYCDYCQLEFKDSSRIWNHIDSKAHKISRYDKTATTNNEESKMKNHLNTSEKTEVPTDGAINSEKTILYDDFIVQIGDNEVYCMICKTEKKLDNVTHVLGNRHVKRQKIFHDNGIKLMKNNYFHCNLCNIEIKNFNEVFFHIGGKTHECSLSNLTMNGNVSENNEELLIKSSLPKLPINSMISDKKTLSQNLILRYNDEDFYCSICNLTIGDWTSVRNHVTTKVHVEGREKFRENKISFRNFDEKYYCDFCLCKIYAFDNVLLHLNGNMHSIARSNNQELSKNQEILNNEVVREKNKMPYHYIVELNDTKDPYCKICDYKISGYVNIEQHVAGFCHDSAMTIFNVNKIKFLKNNDYTCNYCNCKLTGNSCIRQHIRGTRHLGAVQRSKEPKNLGAELSELKDLKPKDPGPKDLKPKDQKKPKDQNPKDLKTEGPESKDLKPKEPEPRDPEPKDQKPKNLKPKDSGPKDPNDQKPKDPVPKHLKNSIFTLYTLAFRKAHQEANNIIKSKDQELPKIEKTTNNTVASKNKLPYHYIVETNKTKNPYCKICDCKIGGYVNIQQHVSGLRHAHAMRLFNVNKIEFKENDDYTCDYCNCKITGNRRIHGHIRSTKHRDAVQRSKESKILKSKVPKPKDPEPKNLKPKCSVPKDPGPKKLMPEVTVPKYPKKPLLALFNLSSDLFNEYGHNIARSKNQELPKIETIKNNVITTKQKLPYHYIIEFNETHAYCKICDCPIGGYVNIEEHVTGLRHAQASRIFNENKIEFKKKDIYHCKYCNCKIYSNLTVKKHIEGYSHLSSLNKSKDPDSNDPKPNFSKLHASKSNFSKPKITSKQQSSENLTHEYIVKINYTDSLCKICNCVILWGQRSLNQHLAGRPHAASLRKYGCENISLVVPATRDYYCKSCDCRVRGDGQIWRHAIGSKHAKSIISCNNNKELGRENEIIDKSKNYIKWRILRRSMKNGKSSNSMNSGRANNSRSRFMRMIWQEQINNSSIPVNCNICKIELPNSVDLHGHVAGHFSKDFTDPNHDNSRIDAMDIDDSGKNESLTESLTHSISTDSICTLASEGENLDFTNAEIPSGKQLMKYIESGTPNHTPKRPNINKITKTLNFDNDDIYRMNDKLRELEIGMKLSYETFSKKQYCLVCHTTTEFTIENYYEHLCSLDHCMYLERMERDHASFAEYPEQFSEIALGLEYMEEISKDHVLCHACETRMFADDDILREHINKKSHTRDSRTMRDLTMKHFESVKLPINCDWYKVERYHCVPCLTTFGSEVNFFEHMTSNDHLYSMERPGNKNRQLLYDFCESCALLWYGYRRTCAYHRSIDTHLFLLHDGYYLSTELPKSAKELLAMPELYINETMRIYEESMAEKREKEDLLIRDMELAVGRKFCHAKAYMFGSRVTGMGSLDCDIDVFLDCGDMYNGKMESRDMIMNTIMDDVSECLNQEAKSWIVEELVKTCRSPIIRAHHRPTGLSCDISFENGLAVENTNLIKSYNDAYPLCREMIIFLKRWLTLCKLAGSEIITSYALYWHVIFYLQHESILPNVEELIKIKNQSRTVDGWEVGATRDFTHNLASSDFTIRQLLTGFYDFWSKFDHRYDVACPMIGKILKKRVFLDFTIMTDDESFYGDHVKKSMEREALRIDSAMCLQDPFDLSHNITKAVGKVYVNRFRKYCSYSLDLLLRS